MMHGTIIQSE